MKYVDHYLLSRHKTDIVIVVSDETARKIWRQCGVKLYRIRDSLRLKRYGKGTKRNKKQNSN